jgi:hypothetical protein
MNDKENLRAPLKTRSTSVNFDWKSLCFICGENCNPKRDNTSRGFSRSWSFVESAISSDSKSKYQKVLDVAIAINDVAIIDRLTSVPNGDLAAIEARYHRQKGCLTKYYAQNTYAFAACTQNKNNSNDQTISYSKIAMKVKHEFQNLIMVDKKVYNLSTLKNRFNEIAEADGCRDAKSYKSYNLKKLFEKLWPEISFIHQHGKPDLVCSSSLTINDAIRESKKSKKLEQVLQHDQECSYDELPEAENDTEESVVHKAIGILRRRIIENNSKLEDHFYSPEETQLSNQKEFVEPLLYKAVCWLYDKKVTRKHLKGKNKMSNCCL